jgi:hypothetical protein
VEGGRGDVAGGGVDAGDPGAEPGHRLAQQPAAAADVEQVESAERRAREGVALPVGGGAVAQVADADRVQLVQRSELAPGIPPFLGDAREARDLGRIDRGVGRAGGGGVLRIGHSCP